MSTLSNVSFDEMLKDPRAHFPAPAAILDAPDMTKYDRLRLLRRWEEDERALVRAGSESPMTGGEQSMLEDVQRAIRHLETGAGES